MLIPIAKADDSLQVVWGFASVIEENGAPIVDGQGDVIYPVELQKTAHEFMRASRAGGFMHAKDPGGRAYQVGEVVESVVLTRELQKALGIDLGMAGWLIGMHIPDKALWAKVKSGELSAFSIGGSGQRTDVEI